MNRQALMYARNVVKGKKHAPFYVRKQCQDILDIYDGKNKKYTINKKVAKLIENVTKIILFYDGYNVGKPVYHGLSGFQWFFIMASLCVYHKADPTKRRFEYVVLEIARKNGKTFLVALLFIILFLTEPRFSRFFSVAPDGALARELKVALDGIIKCSPALSGSYQGRQKFKITRDKIKFAMKDSEYTPLNYSQHRLDGKKPSAFLVDEVGALPNGYAIEAMRSGQTLTRNRLGYAISTKYPRLNNPFEDEVQYCKSVLDGVVEDDAVFSMLFEPDEPLGWETDDEVLLHANPLAVEIPEMFETLKKARTTAIIKPSSRENFLTKHCNIMYVGGGTENFVDVADLEQCEVDAIDWNGREVYIGLDLAMTNDNCAVGMVALDGETLLMETMSFIPEENIVKKTIAEKIDYANFIERGICIACGDYIVDYGVIEQYIMQIESKYNVKVKAVGYDRYNAISTANKLESQGLLTVEIKQHSSVLHPATKYLSEKVADHKAQIERNNLLLKHNFCNAKCKYDTNMNRYVHKKQSSGKIDGVVAILNAVYLLYQDELNNANANWVVQF